MAFNPTATYRTVTDIDGNLFAYQGGTYYDRYGNSFSALPANKEGIAAPTDATVGWTPVAAEVNTLTGLPASVSMTSTPATGTCAVQLTFKDSAGVALAHAVAGLLYFSSSTGLAIAATTSNATLTNGAIQELVAGKVDLFITSVAGLLGFTVTAGAATYYVSIALPNGKILTTGAIVVN